MILEKLNSMKMIVRFQKSGLCKNVWVEFGYVPVFESAALGGCEDAKHDLSLSCLERPG